MFFTFKPKDIANINIINIYISYANSLIVIALIYIVIVDKI